MWRKQCCCWEYILLISQINGENNIVLTDTKGIIRRTTDNTMTKRKRTKGQTVIYKTLHRKLQIDNTNPTKDYG
jgi:hypothetical protein